MAAKLFASGIDAGGIPTVRFRFENLSAAPTALGAGHAYFDTTANLPFFYTGSAFTSPYQRAAHTGTQVAATISDLATVVKGYTLDSFAAPAGNLAMGGFRLTGLADPTGAQDAATRNFVISQVQSAAAGITSKDPVRVVATANITQSGLQTIDGVTLVAGDRVLSVGQTTGSQNGPWVVASGAWTRPTTEGATYELDKGALWLVLEGTTYGTSQWRLSNTGTVTPGTTAITIVQFGAAGAGFTTGNGLNLTSGVLNLVLASSSGLVLSAGGLAVDFTVVARKAFATIGDGSATSYTVNHAFGTRDVQVQVYGTAAPYATVEVDVQRSDLNNVAVVFAAAPAANAYRVVVLG